MTDFERWLNKLMCGNHRCNECLFNLEDIRRNQIKDICGTGCGNVVILRFYRLVRGEILSGTDDC